MLKEQLLKDISSRQARVGIIGLGYVGLPLVIAFRKAGFHVTGFDVDCTKIEKLKRGESYIEHIRFETTDQGKGSFTATDDFSLLADVQAIIVCVPTPLNIYREPEMRYVFGTAETIARHLTKGQLISLESTTYPGTTDEDMRAILERNGLKAGTDFFLAYSPEREDPNNPHFTTSSIPKVVGGLTPDCLEVAVALYDTVIETTVPVSSTKVAEAAKLLENIYRSVNIALVNELKIAFDKMSIDVWEVINAAKTKPFGFQAFYPGPGLGGHCIPIDPFYLTWKARKYNVNTRFIELAGEVNTAMPDYVIGKTVHALNERQKSMKGARILLLGLAYKKNIDDTREAPSFEIHEKLIALGAEVDYNDPHVPVFPKLRKYSHKKESVELTPGNLESYDCVIVVTDHDKYDPEFILAHSRLIVDTRNLIPSSMGNGKVKRA